MNSTVWSLQIVIKEKRKFKGEFVLQTEAELVFGQFLAGYAVKNGKVCSGDKPKVEAVRLG